MGASLARDLLMALDPPRVFEAAGIEPDPWQEALLRSRSDRDLVLASRQSGKSQVVAALALHEALFRPPALVLVLSPSIRQSGETFRRVLALHRQLGHEVPVEAETLLRLEFRNGSRVVALPGTEMTVRGFGGVRLAVLDEAARIDDALYAAVKPMLAVSRGRLVALSTPFGKRGFFFDEWEKGEGWSRTKITAHECPRISADFLERERRWGESYFRQEFLCEFVDTDDAFFSGETIDAMHDESIRPLFAAAGSP